MRGVPAGADEDGAALRADEVRPTGGVTALVGAGLVALGTVKDDAQPLGSAALVEHPGALLERRAVANVDAMSTIEARDPIAAVVTIEADYRPVHLLNVRRLPRSSRSGCSHLVFDRAGLPVAERPRSCGMLEPIGAPLNTRTIKECEARMVRASHDAVPPSHGRSLWLRAVYPTDSLPR